MESIVISDEVPKGLGGTVLSVEATVFIHERVYDGMDADTVIPQCIDSLRRTMDSAGAIPASVRIMSPRWSPPSVRNGFQMPAGYWIDATGDVLCTDRPPKDSAAAAYDEAGIYSFEVRDPWP